MDSDGEEAERAMKIHLEGSLKRYREILRSSLSTSMSSNESAK